MHDEVRYEALLLGDVSVDPETEDDPGHGQRDHGAAQGDRSQPPE